MSSDEFVKEELPCAWTLFQASLHAAAHLATEESAAFTVALTHAKTIDFWSACAAIGYAMQALKQRVGEMNAYNALGIGVAELRSHDASPCNNEDCFGHDLAADGTWIANFWHRDDITDQLVLIWCSRMWVVFADNPEMLYMDGTWMTNPLITRSNENE